MCESGQVRKCQSLPLKMVCNFSSKFRQSADFDMDVTNCIGMNPFAPIMFTASGSRKFAPTEESHNLLQLWDISEYFSAP